MEIHCVSVLAVFALTTCCCLEVIASAVRDDADLSPPGSTGRVLEDSPRNNSRRKDAMADILHENRRINKDIMKGKIAHMLVEGDILVQPSNSSRSRRAVTTREGMKWPGAVVPYIVDTVFKDREKKIIFSAMQRFHEDTCIKFRQRTMEPDYLFITPGNGCWSMVGRQGGMQKLSLSGTCKVRKGTIMHELMHCIGFRHEHNRPDRDTYIRILWRNIENGYAENFAQHSYAEVDTMNTAYDYFSIMHYPLTAFSSSDQWTIQPYNLHHSFAVVGSRHDFSEQDIVRINKLYKCGACTDTDTLYCPVWATRGECHRNVAWMTEHCPLSCDRCPDTSTGGNTVYIENCKDKNGQCATWAQRGECSRNPSYMERHCQRSCQLCSFDLRNRQEPEEDDANACMDKNSLCPEWAVLGECSKSRYMHANCKASCQLCKGAILNRVCQDSDASCSVWAAEGLCRTHTNYMHKNCRKSCKICSTALPATNSGEGMTNDVLDETAHRDENEDEGTEVKCKDKKKQCSTWADAGQCEEYSHWMTFNCPKSCSTCGTLVNKNCLDKEKKCPQWATKRECKKNKGWFIPNCRYSCNACSKPVPTCVDKNRTCRKKAKKGLCLKKAKIRKECPYSCNLCES